MNNRISVRLTFLIALVLALGACRGGKQAQEPAVKVRTVIINASSSPSGLYYSGNIEAARDIGLSFLTAGTVSFINVREGDRVAKGKLLAKLDCQSNENSLQIAVAKAKQAADAYGRFEPMFKNGNLPAIKMVDIETAKTQTELAVKLAEKSVADCSIIAPESGLISERSVEPGDSAIPGKTALRLVSVDKVYASIAVPEKEISAVRRGAGALVELTGARHLSLRGHVSDVGVTANPLSRTYTVRIALPNHGDELLPGMLCNVYLSEKSGGGLVIPATALKMDANGNQFVYVADKNWRVHARMVVTSGFREGGVVVLGGLASGDVVVAEGAQKLEENTLVQPQL